MAKLIKETQGDMPDSIFEVAERCVFCLTPTRYWYGNGVVPVCLDCGKIKTDRQCYNYAKKHGYGPLPDKEDI